MKKPEAVSDQDDEDDDLDQILARTRQAAIAVSAESISAMVANSLATSAGNGALAEQGDEETEE
ncbi:hypothetical protein FGG75_25375, partial [Escherichia coli]|uniref:hypothetical protein n=1 Tax=Escherichia coli TaxID=562 RepID=UPI00127DA61D